MQSIKLLDTQGKTMKYHKAFNQVKALNSEDTLPELYDVNTNSTPLIVHTIFKQHH